MKKVVFLLFSLILIFLFVGCGHSKSSNSIQTITEDSSVKMYFIDAPVEGFKYAINDSKIKYTGEGGLITCNKDDKISFFFGKTKIGDEILCGQKKYITPKDIVKDETKLKNTIAVIQSLDDDNNPDNGITITKNINDKLNYVNIDLQNTDELKKSVEQKIGKTFISPNDAYNHFLDNLYLIKTDNYNIDNRLIMSFINKKIDILNNLKSHNFAKVKDIIKKMIYDYNDDISILKLYSNLQSNLQNDKNTNETFDLLKQIIVKEIFNIDSANLDKIITYMNSGELNENIYINNTSIDASTLSFLKDLNNSILNNEFEFTDNELSAISEYINEDLTADEFKVAKRYLSFYFVSTDKENFISNVSKFYKTDLKNEEDILKYIADYYNVNIDESKVQQFIKNFIINNQKVISMIENFKRNINKMKKEIEEYKEKIKMFFSNNNHEIISEGNGDIVLSPEIDIADYFNIYDINGNNINDLLSKTKFFDEIISFDVEENNVYAITEYGNVYKNKNLILKNTNATQIIVKNEKIYLLMVNGDINIYDANNYNLVYQLNNNIIYNKIQVINGYIYALRIDGKVDIYNNGEIINTLKDKNGLLYINIWASNKYLVCATNNGYLAVYNLIDTQNPGFETYLNINPTNLTIDSNKLFVIEKNKIEYIDLNDKLLISYLILEDKNTPKAITYNNSFLYVYNENKIYAIKVEKDGNLIKTKPEVISSTDIDHNKFNKIKCVNKKLYYLDYGSICTLNIPTAPKNDFEGEIVNEDIRVSNLSIDEIFHFNGNGMSLFNKNNSMNLSGIIFIPVKNNAGKIGIYIKRYSKIYYLTLNNYSLMPEVNTLAINDKYILFNNGYNVTEYVYDIYNIYDNKKFIKFERYLPLLYGNNNSISYPGFETSFLKTLTIPYNGDIYVMEREFGNFEKYSSKNNLYISYDSSKNAYASQFESGTGFTNYIKYNNDLILWRNYATYYTMSSYNLGICKNFFDDNIDFSQKINNCKSLSSLDYDTNIMNDFIIDNDLLIVDNKIYNLYTKNLINNYEFNITDISKFGDFYIVLNSNKLNILNKDFQVIQEIKLNNSYIRILDNGYFLTETSLQVEKKNNNIKINIIPTYNNYNGEIVFDSNNIGNIAKIEVDSSYPYIIRTTSPFTIENNILKVSKNSELDKYSYSFGVYINDLFGNYKNQNFLKAYNLDNFTLDNIDTSYSSTSKHYQHDSCSITSIPFNVYKIINISPELKIVGNSIYLKNPDINEDKECSVDLIGIFNGKLIEYKINVQIKSTKDRYQFTCDSVIDKENNIIWQRTPVAEKVYKFDEAKEKCSNGWKLPTIEELKSIANNDTSLGYDDGFYGPGRTYFWSQTRCDSNGEEGIYMFDYGRELEVCKPLDQSNEEHKPTNAVRCVKENDND